MEGAGAAALLAERPGGLAIVPRRPSAAGLRPAAPTCTDNRKACRPGVAGRPRVCVGGLQGPLRLAALWQPNLIIVCHFELEVSAVVLCLAGQGYQGLGQSVLPGLALLIIFGDAVDGHVRVLVLTAAHSEPWPASESQLEPPTTQTTKRPANLQPS